MTGVNVQSVAAYDLSLTEDRPTQSTKQRPLVIGTAFALDNSHYPNFKMKDRRSCYWQNIAVLMATARRFAQSPAELIVFTTDVPTPEVRPLLARTGVQIVRPSFRYQPPENFYHQFNGAFYLFDTMEWCVERRGRGYDHLILDPDCVLTADIAPIREALRHCDIVGYRLPHRPDFRNGGLIPEEFRRVVEEFAGCRMREAPPQYGGELLGFSDDGLQRLTAALPEFWQTNIDRFRAGKAKFNTEELVVSYLVWRDHPRICDARDRFVKRFWTGFRYRNVRPGDEALPVWHLPGEKGQGIPRLFRDISRGTIRLEEMSEDEVKAYAARVLGLRDAWVRQASYRVLSATGQAKKGLP